VLYILALEQKIEVISDSVLLYGMLGVLIQSLVIADASDAGNSFFSEIPFWVSLMQEFHKHIPGTEAHPHPKVQYHKHLRFKAEGEFVYHALGINEMCLRMVLSIFINCFCRTLIIVTLPLQLARSTDHMDFVLNSFAILFIAGLDDMPDVMSFDIDFNARYDFHGHGAYGMSYVGLCLNSKEQSLSKRFNLVVDLIGLSFGGSRNTPRRSSKARRGSLSWSKKFQSTNKLLGKDQSGIDNTVEWERYDGDDSNSTPNASAADGSLL
jgi:hypothetical protein